MNSADAIALGSHLRAQLKELRASGQAEFYERVDMRAWTALRLGGTADLVIRCRTAGGTTAVLDLLATHGLPWVVMGSGSRLLISDQGIRTPIVTCGGELAGWSRVGDSLTVGAGVGLAQLGRSSAAIGIDALSRLIGTSGSLGGMLARPPSGRSAQALGFEVEWSEFAVPGRELVRVVSGDVADGLVPSRSVLLRSSVAMPEIAPPHGKGSHPMWPARRSESMSGTIGPVFARPGDGDRSARELLGSADCGSLVVGGVRVVQGDANTLRVSRGGSATDVLMIVRRMRARVEERFGVQLTLRLLPVDEYGTAVEV